MSTETAADPREPLGRLVHETRIAHEAGRAAEEGRVTFMLGAWEDRAVWQRELDMRIGAAVANCALTENAVSWGTACTCCARILDAAYAETVRREQAEAKLAAIRSVLLEGGQDAGSVRRALAIIGSEEENGER